MTAGAEPRDPADSRSTRFRGVLDAGASGGRNDVELGWLVRDGDTGARRVLIERYIPLARSLALRYRRTAEPLDDLIQVASLALVKAVDRWDPDRGHAFSTFAVPTILGELRRHFRDTTWMVRPPRHILELSLLVEHAREPMGALLGRDPTAAEFAERLGRSEAEVAEALQAGAGRSVRSLDNPVQDAEQTAATVGDLIGDDDAGFERADERATIELLSSILDERARQVLRMRYEHDLLQSEIAAVVGCSQMQVSRIIRTSLERLFAYGTARRGGWSMTDTIEGATTP